VVIVTKQSPLLHKMLSSMGSTKDFRKNSAIGEIFRKTGVRDTPELQRIRFLPERDWHDLLADNYLETLSRHLRRPGSSAMLFETQGAALTEFYDYGGFLGNIGLGEGKCVTGDTVLYDPEQGRLQVRETRAAFCRVLAGDVAPANVVRSGTKLCRRVILRDGTKLELSFDHPVLTQVGWLPAGDLDASHMVAVARRYPAPDSPIQVSQEDLLKAVHGVLEKRMPPEWWCLSDDDIRFFLGKFWVAHGRCTEKEGKQGLAAGFKRADEEVIQGLIEDLRFLCLRLGILTRPYSNSYFNEAGIVIRPESAAAFLELEVSQASKQDRQLLAERIENLNRNATDVVPVAFDELREIAQEENWPRGVSKHARETYKFARNYASRKNFSAFCEALEYRGKYAWLAHNDYVWERVSETELIGECAVYDVSVPDYHNFIGNGAMLHNTLITALAPTLVGAERPVLLAPGSLRTKTKRDFDRYREDWLIHPRIEFVSYEQLSRNPQLLVEINPDVLMADEVHCLKNLKAGCTKRVKRYMGAYEDIKFLGLSGTVSTRSLREFWHLMMWALGPKRMPLPNNYDELDEWARAIDEKVDAFDRVNPGMLLVHLGGQHIQVPEKTLEHEKEIVQARMAVRKRLEKTAGYMMTTKINCDASLSIKIVRPPPSPILDAAIEELRSTLADRNGDEVVRPADVWAKARMMSCGFFYRWVPEPPPEWIEARRHWFRFVRHALDRFSMRLDTPLQVAQDVDAGNQTELFDVAWTPQADETAHEPDMRLPVDILARWREMQPTYKYKLVPEWLDEARAQWIVDNYLKGEEEAWIVWVEHVAMGQKLAELSGRPFHHHGGLDQNGTHIEQAQGPIIASVESNYKGMNLQQYHRNFIVSCMPSGKMWEQLFGRTHRRGQEADHVYYDVMEACPEHAEGFVQVMRDAAYAYQTQNQPQRLLLADRVDV
jgi:hypothetical protein